jgi:hypothetical protein
MQSNRARTRVTKSLLVS